MTNDGSTAKVNNQREKETPDRRCSDAIASMTMIDQQHRSDLRRSLKPWSAPSFFSLFVTFFPCALSLHEKLYFSRSLLNSLLTSLSNPAVQIMRNACSVCFDEGFVVIRLELQSGIPMRRQSASDDARMYKISTRKCKSSNHSWYVLPFTYPMSRRYWQQKWLRSTPQGSF